MLVFSVVRDNQLNICKLINEGKGIAYKEFPILEFDESRVAIIEATNFIKPKPGQVSI